MGGWLALLLARELARQGRAGGPTLAGLVLIAPAVDFTEELMWKRMPPAIQRADRGDRRLDAAVGLRSGAAIRSRAA